MPKQPSKKKKLNKILLAIGIALAVVGACLLWDYLRPAYLTTSVEQRDLPAAASTSAGNNLLQTFTGRQIARDSQGNIYMLGKDAGTNEHFIYIYKNGALSSTRKIEQITPTGFTATYGTSPRCSAIAIDQNDVIYVVFDSYATEEGVGNRRFIIEFIKSIDYGDTWTQPYVCLSAPLDYSGSPLYYREMDSPTLLIDSAGGLHIFYQGSSIYKTTEVVYSKSIDQGVNWDYYEVVDHSQNLTTVYGTVNLADIQVAIGNNNYFYVWAGGTIGVSEKEGYLASTSTNGQYWGSLKVLPDDFGYPEKGRDILISGNKIIFVGGSSNSLVWGESSDEGNSWTVHKETISSNDSPYPRLVILNGQITVVFPYWEVREGKYYLGFKAWHGSDDPTSILQFDTPLSNGGDVFLDISQSSKATGATKIDMCVITGFGSSAGGSLYSFSYPYQAGYVQGQTLQPKPAWELALGVLMVVGGLLLVLMAVLMKYLPEERRTREAVGRAERPMLPPVKLSNIDAAVLDYIERHGGVIFPSKAARELGVSKGEVEASMRRLRRAGRIEEE